MLRRILFYAMLAGATGLVITGIIGWRGRKDLATMKLSEVFPQEGHVEGYYCDACHKHFDLTFVDFRADVSGIDISIAGLPVLRCNKCNRDHLPDFSRIAVSEQYRMAKEKGLTSVRVSRSKPNKKFGFTNIPFLYDF